jgi:hypothetical protein
MERHMWSEVDTSDSGLVERYGGEADKNGGYLAQRYIWSEVGGHM